MYFLYSDEKGVTLLITLAYLAILTLVGATALLSITTDTTISSNYKGNVKAFYAAQAGAHEARQRLSGTSVVDPIEDSFTADSQWLTVIRPTKEGYSYTPTDKLVNDVPSLQTRMDYTVEITHQVDDSIPPNVIYWGDANDDGVFKRHTDATRNDPNIFLIKNMATADGAFTGVTLEAVKVPPVRVHGALYVEISADIQGDTFISGINSCGWSDDVFGIATPPAGVVTGSGDWLITGLGVGEAPIDDVSKPTKESKKGKKVKKKDVPAEEDSINYSDSGMAVPSMADFLKKSADFSYSVNGATHTASTTPGPGDGWGTPTPGATPEDPSSCTTCNIVHYDTNATYISLSGGVTGCGILVVEGNLYANDGFSWYGTIIVTGDFIFTGNGDKNITGAVISGGSTYVSTTGGALNILYCSTATSYQADYHPLSILTWKEGSVE